MPIFFLFFLPPPTCSFFIFFFHQDAYKCFPFIILYLNINAQIFIIRKPTLFLCSFHNDDKYFVGYFWNSKNKNARTLHALDIAEIYLTIFSLCFTFAEPFNGIFLFVKSSCALGSGNTTKVYDPRKEGRIDRLGERPSEWIRARHLTPISHSAK